MKISLNNTLISIPFVLFFLYLLSGLRNHDSRNNASWKYIGLNSDKVKISIKQDITVARATEDRNDDSKYIADLRVSRPSYNKSKGFFTLNGKLYDANGHEFVARGINNTHARFDKNGDGVDRPYDDIDNIASFGANSIRIQWYAKKNNPAHLEKIIQKTIDHDMVPLVDATHDLKGKTDPNQLLDFGVKSITDNADIYQKYEKYALIELGSEFGDWKMSKNQREQFPIWYKQAISKIRDAGINNTIVISPFNWGTDYTLIKDYGREIYEHDPLKNIMFDVHFYKVEGSSQAKIADAFDSITGQGLPLIIGEFANEHPVKGWERGTPVVDIEDEFIMAQAEKYDVGYYPWAWNDWEPELGRFALAHWGADSRDDLTADGRKLILDDPNGIANTAEIASIFCSSTEKANTLNK